MPSRRQESRNDDAQQRQDGGRGAGGIAVGKLRVRRGAVARTSTLQRCTRRIKKVEGYNCKLRMAYKTRWQQVSQHGVANKWEKLAGRGAGANKLYGERRKRIKSVATPQK